MKKLLSLAAVVLLLTITADAANFTEYYFKFKLDAGMHLDKISRIISIDNVKDGEVYAYANDRELSEFQSLGISFELLPRPSTLIIPEMYTFDKGVWDFDTYPTYSTYLAMMDSFAVAFPSLCIVETVGSSVEGRSIVFAKISDNVNIEEDEPEVMYTGTIHGDETTGYVSMLRLIHYLLNNYGTDSLVTRLVDSCEIWINPASNPDGTYAGGNNTVSGATRYNANGYDLNRNFPDPEDGQYPGGTRQVETQVMMDFADAQSFVIAANYHGGAEVVNYPWDTWSTRHADDTWWQAVSNLYADSAQYFSPSGYLDDFGTGITNGYDWYTISGGRQDYMNYYRGCREVTLEISNTKLPSQSTLPNYWNYLRVSFLNYFEHALYGIRGIVTDAQTGLPVAATITLSGHDNNNSFVFTDPDVGDYHRMVSPGTYTMIISAAGYIPDTTSGITISNYIQTIRIDRTLEPIPDDPIISYAGTDLPVLNPGDDNIPMTLSLRNDGGGIAYNVRCSLYTADPYISFREEAASFPNIAPLGGIEASLVDYIFSVDASCPNNYMATIQMYITADDYENYTQFQLPIGQIIEDFETGDFTLLDWIQSGDAAWTITSSGPYEGTYCAKSGNIGDDENSQIAVTVEVASAGNITFRYKVSSESGWDYLRFLIDDQEKGSWAGTVAWAQATFPVTAGTHTFAWKYDKDESQSSGSDCGWIDYIVFPPLVTEAVAITTTSLPNWTAGVPYSQQLQASGGTGNLTWTDNDGGLSGTGLTLSTGGLLSGTPSSSGLISFEARVEDEVSSSDLQVLQFNLSPAVNITTTSIPDAVLDAAYSYQLTADGGLGNKTWNDQDDDLTALGLTLNGGGTITGTPTSTGTVEFTAVVVDQVGSTDQAPLTLNIAASCICGDIDNDGKVDILDIISLINYKFKSGSAPEHPECANVNNDANIDVLDIVALVNFKFKSGPNLNCGLK